MGSPPYSTRAVSLAVRRGPESGTDLDLDLDLEADLETDLDLARLSLFLFFCLS